MKMLKQYFATMLSSSTLSTRQVVIYDCKNWLRKIWIQVCLLLPISLFIYLVKLAWRLPMNITRDLCCDVMLCNVCTFYYFYYVAETNTNSTQKYSIK